MDLAVQLLMNTLQIGAVYVLFSLGMTLIFGVMKVINFAHGQFFAMTMLIMSGLIPMLTRSLGLPPWLDYLLACVAALVVVVVTSAILYWGGFNRFLRDLLGSFALSIGVLLLWQGILQWIFGGTPRFVPRLLEGGLPLMGGAINSQRLVIFVAAVAFTAVLYAFVKYTRLGMALRAVADDREAAMLQGIKYQRTTFYGFLIGSVLAAIAGALMAPVAVITPTSGDDYLVKSFIIIIIGGLGSIPGTIAAGFLMAAVESIGGQIVDPTFATIAMFVLVMVFLLVRPRGLAGNELRLT